MSTLGKDGVEDNLKQQHTHNALIDIPRLQKVALGTLWVTVPGQNCRIAGNSRGVTSFSSHRDALHA